MPRSKTRKNYEIPFLSDKGSELELAFVTHWIRHAPDHLPWPRRELCLLPDEDYRCDFIWMDERVVVECDGGQWKAGGGRHNTDTDRHKVNRLQMDGWIVLRYSGTQINGDTLNTIAEIVECLGLRGTS